MNGRKAFALTLVLLFSLLLFLHTADYTLRPDDEGVRTRLEDFYAQPGGTLDVVFVGSSATYAFFSPLRLYGQTGLTSVLYATPNQSVPMLRYILEEGRRSQPGALYVIELRPMLASHEDNLRISADLRRLTDNMPWSLNRARCIEALAPDPDTGSWHLDLVKYHDRWAEMKLSDLRLRWGKADPKRGFAIDTRIEPVLESNWITTNTAILPEAENESALRDLLDYVQQRDLNVLFVATPFSLSREQEKKYNAVSSIINEYGYDFIDLNRRYHEIGLDFKTDFSDFRHVNILGAIKCTDYIGNVLREKTMPCGRSDQNTWDKALTAYLLEENAAVSAMEEGLQHE
ncbi:MAG: hypothetical protein IJV40_16100 [Oscillospiraceae bacterium]|nr:hypothetical protein [Oscillospiraceae bacterium]